MQYIENEYIHNVMDLESIWGNDTPIHHVEFWYISTFYVSFNSHPY